MSTKLKIIAMVLGPLATNGYIVFDEETKNAMIIDPADEAKKLNDTLKKHDLTLKKIVLTHAHADHIGALNELREQYPDVPVIMHPADTEYMSDPVLNLSAYQFGDIICEPADEYVSAGDTITLDSISLEVRETPGHTPGGISLYAADPGVVFSGDALFNGSVGRTDFKNGSMEVLLKGIREELMTLPDETLVLSGHGPATTIGKERQWNPFLGGFVW